MLNKNLLNSIYINDSYYVWIKLIMLSLININLIIYIYIIVNNLP